MARDPVPSERRRLQVYDAWREAWSEEIADTMMEMTDRSFLDQQVARLRFDLDALRADFELLRAEVAVMKEDLAELKADVAVIKADVGVLQADVGVLKADVADLKQDVASVKIEMSGLRADMHQLVNGQTWRVMAAMLVAMTLLTTIVRMT